MSEHMNRTQADLEAADEAAKNDFGINTDPQHREGTPLSAPEDRERQPAHQPENREPAVADHNPYGADVDWADSGSTKESAVNYQGPATNPGDESAPQTSGGTDHQVQGKNKK